MKRFYIYFLTALICLVSYFFICTKDYSSLLNFRTSNSGYQWWTFTKADATRLKSLNISGSGLLHEKALRKDMEKTGVPAQKIFIINLSEEHQYYTRGRPLRWFGWQKTDQGIAELHLDTNFFFYLKNIKYFLRRFRHLDSKPLVIETEPEMIKRLNYHYQSFIVNRRQVYPPKTIDDFLDFVKTLPEGAWLHFHCNGGNSRTTTMMILYDIIRNGDVVSLDDIIRRQKGIGGVDVNDTAPYTHGTWKEENLIMRKTMIQDFYRYRNDPEGFPKITWTQWFQKNGQARAFL